MGGCPRTRHAGRREDFFALGGDVCHALRITTRLRQVLGVQPHSGRCSVRRRWRRRPTSSPSASRAARPADARRSARHRRYAHGGRRDAVGADRRAASRDAAFRVTIRTLHRLGGSAGPAHAGLWRAIGPVIAALDSSAPTASFADLSVEALGACMRTEILPHQPFVALSVCGLSFGGRGRAGDAAATARRRRVRLGLLVIFDTFMPGGVQAAVRLRWIGEHIAGVLGPGTAPSHATARRRHGPEIAMPAADPSGDGAIRASAKRRLTPTRRAPIGRNRMLVGSCCFAPPPMRCRRFRANPRLGWERIAPDTLQVRASSRPTPEILSRATCPSSSTPLRRYLAWAALWARGARAPVMNSPSGSRGQRFEEGPEQSEVSREPLNPRTWNPSSRSWTHASGVVPSSPPGRRRQRAWKYE